MPHQTDIAFRGHSLELVYSSQTDFTQQKGSPSATSLHRAGDAASAECRTSAEPLQIAVARKNTRGRTTYQRAIGWLKGRGEIRRCSALENSSVLTKLGQSAKPRNPSAAPKPFEEELAGRITVHSAAASPHWRASAGATVVVSYLHLQLRVFYRHASVRSSGGCDWHGCSVQLRLLPLAPPCAAAASSTSSPLRAERVGALPPSPPFEMHWRDCSRQIVQRRAHQPEHTPICAATIDLKKR